MKLNELDEVWQAEQDKAAAVKAQAERWLGSHNSGRVEPAVTRSLYCQRNVHARCNWAECKCVCHDSADWCGSC